MIVNLAARSPPFRACLTKTAVTQQTRSPIQRLEHPTHVGMRQDYGRLSLERLVVAAREPIASFRRGQELPDLFDERSGVCARGRRLVLDGLMDSDDELGQGVQPGKPGI